MKEFNKEGFKIETIRRTYEEPSKLINGVITIGYDVSKEKDHCCLLVMKKAPLNSVMVLNEFYDEEAAEILTKLLSKNQKTISHKK